MSTSRLVDLPAVLELESLAARREQTAIILERLAHDLSGSATTMSLESEGLDLVVGDAARALAAGDTTALSAALAEVAEIAENLELAAKRLKLMEQLARDLSDSLAAGGAQ